MYLTSVWMLTRQQEVSQLKIPSLLVYHRVNTTFMFHNSLSANRELSTSVRLSGYTQACLY